MPSCQADLKTNSQRIAESGRTMNYNRCLVGGPRDGTAKDFGSLWKVGGLEICVKSLPTEICEWAYTYYQGVCCLVFDDSVYVRESLENYRYVRNKEDEFAIRSVVATMR